MAVVAVAVAARHLRGERHLVQELLLGEAAELELLLGVAREGGVLLELDHHLKEGGGGGGG